MVYVQPWDPPGFLTFSHASWRTCEMCDKPVPLIAVVDRRSLLMEMFDTNQPVVVRLPPRVRLCGTLANALLIILSFLRSVCSFKFPHHTT